MPLWMTSITGRSFVKIPAPNLIASPSTTVRAMPRTMLSCKVERAITMNPICSRRKRIDKNQVNATTPINCELPEAHEMLRLLLSCYHFWQTHLQAQPAISHWQNSSVGNGLCSAVSPWASLHDNETVIWPVLRRPIHRQEETWRARAGSRFGNQPWWLVHGGQPATPPGWHRTSRPQPLLAVGILKQKENSESFFEDPLELLSSFRIPTVSHHIQEIAQISEI